MMNIGLTEIVSANPVIQMMETGIESEVVDMPKCEREWFYNEDGEYVYDG